MNVISERFGCTEICSWSILVVVKGSCVINNIHSELFDSLPRSLERQHGNGANGLCSACDHGQSMEKKIFAVASDMQDFDPHSCSCQRIIASKWICYGYKCRGL